MRISDWSSDVCSSDLRMTMAQGVFFLLAASADIAGKPTTFTEIKEAQGEAINRSLHSTYRVLLTPSRTFPKGLDWLARVENPQDNREKLLKLTPKGREIIREVIAAYSGEEDRKSTRLNSRN